MTFEEYKKITAVKELLNPDTDYLHIEDHIYHHDMYLQFRAHQVYNDFTLCLRMR